MMNDRLSPSPKLKPTPKRKLQTPWFESGTRPWRAGVYRIRYRGLTAGGWSVTRFAYWSARLGWRASAHSPAAAMKLRYVPNGGRRAPEWRGLAADPGQR
jgi:hypothetical protein